MAKTTKAAHASDLGKMIGRNVKAARTRLGLTQSELGQRLGMDSITISRLETGVQVPSLERLNKVAVALETSLSLLVTDAEEDEGFDRLLSATLKDLPLREREFVYAFAAQYAEHWRAGAKG